MENFLLVLVLAFRTTTGLSYVLTQIKDINYLFRKEHPLLEKKNTDKTHQIKPDGCLIQPPAVKGN